MARGRLRRDNTASVLRWLRLVVFLTALQSISCGGKAHGNAPRSEASAGASSGGAPGAVVLEQHLLVAKAGLRASNPDAAWGGDRLGVAYLIDSNEGRKGLGISVSRSRSVARDGFAQTVLGEPSARRSLRIASVSDGYAVLWLEAGQMPEALMLLMVDGSGHPRADAVQLGRADAMQFSVASVERTLAVAGQERDADADSWSVTLQLVRDSVVVAPLLLDSCAQQASAPAVVWDGAAFDVVYVCADAAPSAPRLKLARVSELGEVLGAPRDLDAQPTGTHCPSLALSFDRGALSLVYASQVEPAALSFVRIDPERATPLEPRSLQGVVPPGKLSLAATPTGYQVLSTDCASQNSSSVAVTLCALDVSGAPSETCRRMPTSSSVPRPSTLVAAPEGAFFVYDEYSLSSHPGVFVVELPNAPATEFSAVPAVSPVGQLSPGSLACSGRHCRLQSYRAQGRFRSTPPRAREYDTLGNVEALSIDLDSEQVETHSAARPLFVRTAQVVQSGPSGPFALLDRHVFDDPPSPSELVGLDRNLTELWSLPIEPGTLFAEAGGVRSFTNNALDDVFAEAGSIVQTAQRNRRPVYDLASCGGAYYDIDAERHTIYRLEPRVGAESKLFASVPEGRGWLRCTEGMVCAQTTSDTSVRWWCWDHAGKALPGAVFAGYDSRFFTALTVALGPDLGLALIEVEKSDRIALTRLRPDGTTTQYDLHAPNGLRFGAWVASGDARTLHLAWNDPSTGDTYLSTWDLH